MGQFQLKIDDTLLRCVIQGTIEGLSMTSIVPKPVGASSLIHATRTYSVLVSLYGQRNGSMTLNFTDHNLIYLAAKLMGEDIDPSAQVEEDTLDVACEIGNIIAGRYKDLLSGTPYKFDQISLPALIVGASYNLYHSRGITSAAVEFEIEEVPVMRIKDKFFTSAISMMKI